MYGWKRGKRKEIDRKKLITVTNDIMRNEDRNMKKKYDRSEL